MSNVQIRDAKKEDIVSMVAWGELMHEESQFSQYPWDGFKVMHLVEFLIESDDGIAFVAELVDDEETVMIGGFIGVIQESFYGPARYAMDMALFVAPEFRNSTAGIRLLQTYVKKAREQGADEITIGNSTGVESDRVEKLFERMGFTRYGGNYRMNAKGV